jgi:hypothetical protein
MRAATSTATPFLLLFVSLGSAFADCGGQVDAAKSEIQVTTPTGGGIQSIGIVRRTGFVPSFIIGSDRDGSMVDDTLIPQVFGADDYVGPFPITLPACLRQSQTIHLTLD